jgi:dipeptidase E
MGGGETGKLLHDITSADFGTYLRQAAKQNIPIYGGSAGAIILGKSIKTTTKVGEKKDQPTEGLSMLHGYSVICHHNSGNYADAIQLAREINQPLIVLTEQSGALLHGSVISSIGAKPVVLVAKDGETIEMKPGEKGTLQEI